MYYVHNKHLDSRISFWSNIYYEWLTFQVFEAKHASSKYWYHTASAVTGLIKLTLKLFYPEKKKKLNEGINIVVGLMKIGNIVPRVGLEPTSLSFQTSVLPLHHIGSLI